MNVKLAWIFARRSVRRFTEHPVDDTTIRDLLEAAMAAPSAVASDPWSFVVVKSAQQRAGLAAALPHGQMLREAPLAIVICGDMTRAHRKQESYMLQDCTAAAQNILLAATTLGLGTCWVGTHPNFDRMKKIAALLKLPENVVPVITVAVGHPGEFPAPRTRYDATRVHHETWQ